jgi:hypothetical protein
MADLKMHLWIALDFIPGAKDTDILHRHEEAGVFALEVESVRLDAIREFGFKSYRTLDHEPEEGPQNQSNRAQELLRHSPVVRCERRASAPMSSPTARAACAPAHASQPEPAAVRSYRRLPRHLSHRRIR